MIYVLITGGLGNQMFQYVFYKYLKSNKKDVILDTSYCRHFEYVFELKDCFDIDKYDDKKDHFNLAWRQIYKIVHKIGNKAPYIWLDCKDHIIEPDEIKGYGVFNGYWMDHKYADLIGTDIISKIFEFKNVSNSVNNLADQLSRENSAAIHVRRGDYLNVASKFIQLFETDYYTNAIEHLKGHNEVIKYYIFSDDIEWCKSSGLFPSDSIYVGSEKQNKSYEDLFLMSKCKYIISANSSFSWWASYLGNHTEIIRPEKYLVNWSDSDDKRLYPDKWTKISLG